MVCVISENADVVMFCTVTLRAMRLCDPNLVGAENAVIGLLETSLSTISGNTQHQTDITRIYNTRMEDIQHVEPYPLRLKLELIQLV
jgi:hypothetical protein